MMLQTSGKSALVIGKLQYIISFEEGTDVLMSNSLGYKTIQGIESI